MGNKKGDEKNERNGNSAQAKFNERNKSCLAS